MRKFFSKFKKPCCWPFLAHFPKFLENLALSHTTSYGFLAPCKNLEKPDDAIPRKSMERQKDRRTDRQTDPTSQDPSRYRWGSKISF